MPFHPVLEEWDAGLVAGDPLDFPGYAGAAAEAGEVREVGGDDAGVGRAGGQTGGRVGVEAVRTGRTQWYAFVENRFDVHGGTMGAAVGEKVVRAYDRSRKLALPMVVVTRTGGARVQEGMVALVQLPRTVAAAQRHAAAGLLSLAVYGSPTTGGVFVSYASTVDVRAAHPQATIGFAGPRVAEEALGASLPPGSHTAGALYEHGLLDALVDAGKEAEWVEAALGLRDRPLPTRPLPAVEDPGVGGAWGEVLRARAPGRPTGVDRAARLCRSWLELRGGDPSVRAGLATLGSADGHDGSRGVGGLGPVGEAAGGRGSSRTAGSGETGGLRSAEPAGDVAETSGRRRCVVVATDRYYGAGRPTPAGYRLAQRAVELAGRLGLPVVTLVDTPGADPSTEAEAEGVGVEMARTFAAFAACPTPVVSVCVGEGGSGGALALSFGDRLLMCEHAIFSVIGPEGAAEILERDAGRAPDVAERLRLTAGDLVELGVADSVIGESQAAIDAAILAALDGAVVGDRERRLDLATARWLVE